MKKKRRGSIYLGKWAFNWFHRCRFSPTTGENKYPFDISFSRWSGYISSRILLLFFYKFRLAWNIWRLLSEESEKYPFKCRRIASEFQRSSLHLVRDVIPRAMVERRFPRRESQHYRASHLSFILLFFFCHSRQILSGQLEISGGAWVMTDEATPTFYSAIQNMIEGHSFIHQQFNITPKTSWSEFLGNLNNRRV